MATAKSPIFRIEQLIAKEQRRMERLVRAAYGVGATHRWFRILPRDAQIAKVQEWVEEALEAAEDRRARSAGTAVAGRDHA